MNLKITPFIQKLIEDNIEYIEHNNFEIVYGNIPVSKSDQTGILTDILLTSGINPLEHMSYIPSHYLAGSEAFEIVIPDNVTTIMENAFWKSNIRKFIIPSSITDVRPSAFCGASKLIELDMSKCQDDIPSSMCHPCLKLEKVILPDTLEHIGKQAFALNPRLYQFDINQPKDYVYNNIVIDPHFKNGGLDVSVKCTDGWLTLSQRDGTILG